jgi:hypothetical protein
MLKHKIFERQIIKKKIGIKKQKQKQKQNRHNQLMLPTSERGVPN